MVSSNLRRKKVTFGFIINPEAKSRFGENYGRWSDYLHDDFSAVLTDCVNSVIELDAECNFVRYLSLTDSTMNNKISDYDSDDTVPIRFSEIIKKFVVGKAVGVFLLNNGDIIISKDQKIRFVKRNLKWLNFAYDAFYNALSKFRADKKVNKKLIPSVFASVLDVSFAHTGGIIAIVTGISDLTKIEKDGFPILSPCDYLGNKYTFEELAKKMEAKDVSEKEINKRILKRKVLETLVEDKNFTALDRKLRCELISMDGACILTTTGRVCSFGAIVKNKSGSSGGGRGAAAKRLSEHGIAIKISTDGYIELFINGEVEYSIK